MLRRLFGIVALAVAVFAYVQKQQVGTWESEPFRVPYSGESLSRVPIQIVKDGDYLVQIEVTKNAEDEGISAPKTSPLDSLVTFNGKEIGEATEWGAYGQDAVWFSNYRFGATVGQRVLLTVKSTGAINTYKSHKLHLVVSRDNWDYGMYMLRDFGWSLLIVLSLAFAIGLYALHFYTQYICRNARKHAID